MIQEEDINYMRGALALAQRGLGRTWPNPTVGCVIVKGGDIIGRGHTADGGRPHAEVRALEQVAESTGSVAGRKGSHSGAAGAVVYVTLEPCAHYGKTPPCVDALINAGVARVVIGDVDVDPRTGGKSIEKLKQAGICVDVGVLQEDCVALNAGFIKVKTKGLPFVTLKSACTYNGHTVIDNEKGRKEGKGRWITANPARRHVHMERSIHDAILVGIGTVKADDPLLTTRIAGWDHNLVRIIMDRKLSISENSKLVKSSAQNPLWVYCDENYYRTDNQYQSLKNSEKIELLESRGAKIFPVGRGDNGENNIISALKHMAKQGITRLFVEGGARIHKSFIDAGICDQLLIYRSLQVKDGIGEGLFSLDQIDKISGLLDLKKQKTVALGQDLLEIYTHR